MSDIWVFAYGSNMDLHDLKSWLSERPEFADSQILECEIGTLSNYELVWNYYSKTRRAGAANVQPKQGRSLPGLVLKVNETCLAGIDKKEGHPNYYDRGNNQVSAILADGRKISCWLYVARPEHTKEVIVPPSAKYLNLLINAAKRYSFPAWYLGELQSTPVQETDED
ncbi:MAG: hypothetical protein DKT66_23170 [Candidatus Melainabacteria bacterium]|nr:MAG: hypothetical protein DKT66_23170 [Candidatus Melainabacteria bacterium]